MAEELPDRVPDDLADRMLSMDLAQRVQFAQECLAYAEPGGELERKVLMSLALHAYSLGHLHRAQQNERGGKE